jgi:Xaa-Pro aminopeptidase
MKSAFNSLFSVMNSASDDKVVGLSAAKYPDFPVEEYYGRFNRIRALMDVEGIDALVLTQAPNLRYFSGYRSLLWLSKFRLYGLLIPRDPAKPPRLILPTQELGNGQFCTVVDNLVEFPDQGDPVGGLLQAVKEADLPTGARIGMELGFGQRLAMTYLDFKRFETSIAPAKIVDCAEIVQSVRMIKSEAEIGCIRRSNEISQIATEAGFSAIKPGMTEAQLMAIIHASMYENGADPATDPSVFSVFSGPDRYFIGNAIAADRKLEPGDLIDIDGGAVFKGYATDYIRQACVGKPTGKQLKYFNIAREAGQACIAALKPGVVASEIYDVAMDVFRRHDVEQFSLINIAGHGNGLDFHELPWLGEAGAVYSADTVIQEGMVFCIEPVFARVDDPDHRDGTWIVEDTVVVRSSGAERLTDRLSTELWCA